MRILLIATNRHNRWMSREEVRPLPIGLAYVAAYIKPDKHQLRVLDLMFSEDYLGETRRVIKEFQPQLVGISLRNLDNGSFIDPQSALPVTREVIQCIRDCSSAIVTCGGPAFSTLPEECFQYLQPDVGLTGDAAETFAELADLLEASKPYKKLSGVVYQENGEVKTAPQRAASGLSCPPRFDELDLDQYRRAGFGIGVITKLGWYSSTMAQPTPDDDWRIVRPVDEVIGEIRRLQRKYSLKEFFFIDQGFNRPVQYAKELCQRIVDEELSIKWNTNLRSCEIDEELMSLMVKAGCRMALVGGANLVSHSMFGDGTEEMVQLASDLAGLQRLCDLCHSEGLNYAITQGFGEPGESKDTVRTKLAFLCTSAGPGRKARVNLRVGNRLLPGTDLTQRALQEGIIKDDKELLMPVFYVAPSVRGELLPILNAAVEHHPSWSIL